MSPEPGANPADRRRWVMSLGTVVLIVVVALGAIAEARLRRLIRSPATELMPARLPLEVPQSPLRALDLGYLHVSVPPHFEGEPRDFDASGFVQIHSVQPDTWITFAPPGDASSPPGSFHRSLIDGFQPLAQSSLSSLFDLYRTAVATKPFSIWETPFLGYNGAKARIALLQLKKLEVRDTAIDLRLHETPELGAIIQVLPDMTLIDVFDHGAGARQNIIISAPPELRDRAIQGVLFTYRLTTRDVSKGNTAALLRAAGIPVQSPTSGE